MKQCITSIVCLLTALFATAGAISKSNQNPSDDYTPMVVEGRTWWQEVEGRTGHFLNYPYVKHELGLSIGSEVMIDGVKWNKVYMNTFRDLDKVKDGIILDEDEGLLAYIREQDRKVYCKLLDDSEYTGRIKNILGKDVFAYRDPWYLMTAESPNDVMLIYDFNRVDAILGTLDTEWPYYGYEQCRYVSDCEIQNSGRTYRSHKYFHMVDQSVYDDEVVECVEGIGMTKSVWLGDNIFFLPLLDPELTNFQPMLLRYVTDKENNIIFEQEGGTKLWTEVSGVGNVSADRVAEGETLWYNLQGVRVDCPTMPGVYIQKSGNSTKKVMVK